MTPHILSISTLNPPFGCSQSEIANKMIEILSLEKDKEAELRKIYSNSAIGYRYTVSEDFFKEREHWSFWGKDYPEISPDMRQRNDQYKKDAPSLAHEAALQAIEAWGGEKDQITHIISVSCTGVLAPGLEFQLIESLNLNPSVHRIGINFMGCFGAFKGLQVASAFAREDSSHRVLLVCTELCSLHLQNGLGNNALIANSLFSDGSAAAIVGCEARSYESPAFSIIEQKSMALENSQDKMTWEAGNHGFLMHLSPFVPALIKRNVHRIIDPLLKGHTDIPSCNWAVHPGGKSILQAVEKALDLTSNQIEASWKTLWNYGNMSSSTFLFVLKEIMQQPTEKAWTAGVGFGPGLCMEGILLKNV